MYAANVNYDTVSSKLQTGVATFTDINTLTVGNVTIHGIDGGNGNPYGITIGDDNDGTGNHVMISNQDISATGSVHASTVSTGFSRMEGGKLFAQNGLYIGTTDLNDPKYENSRFAVNGDDGSFKAASGKFNVSDSGAITADSLTLADNYNVKDKIEANKKSTEDNKAALGTLETKTQGITRVDGDSTTVDGVNFKEGAVSGVQSINDNLKFESDGIYLNKGDQAKQIKIGADGKIIIGTSSSAYDTNGFYAGGDDYDAAKAGMKSDGSLKATGFAVDGANGNTTVGGNLTVNGAANFDQETTFANGIKTDTISEKTNDVGVTVDGVVLQDGGITATGNVTTTGDIQGANITATGALEGKTLGIGTNGSEFTVDANGNAAVGGTLDVTGKTTLKNELQVNEKATFGIAIGSQTVINGGDITATGKLTSKSASIGTVGITDTGVVTGITKLTAKELDVTDSLNIAGDIAGSTLKGNSLKITGDATIGGGLAVTGNITGAKINGAAITETSFNGAQISTNKFNGVTLETNGNVTGGTITGTIVMDGAGASMNAGTVTGTTITDGNGFTATGGNVVAKKITADTAIIAGVNFAAGGSVSGINDLTATGTIKGSILKVDETNYWNSEGLQAKKAVIDSVVIDDASITTTGANGLKVENVKLDNGAITADSAIIGGVNKLDNTGISVATDQKIQVGNNTVIEDGSVKVSQKTSLTDQSLQLNDTNKWTQAGGLVADKATVNGIALGTDSKGKATFTGADGQTTTIDGNKINTGIITADKLLIDKISLGKDGNDNISIDKNGNVTTKGDVTVTGADSDTTVIDGAKATFGKDAANQTVIDKGTISANAKNINGQQAGLTFDENGLTVNGQNKGGKISSFSFNANTGISTFTGQDRTTTTINGSAITSTKADGNTGVLDGSNLTLTNGANKTVMTAGGVTFTGKQGASTKKYNTTMIDGGIITTDTLKVQRIQLGEKIVDERTGQEIGSGVTLAADGGFTAAGGNFKVVGGATGSRGSITNVVGDDNSGKTVFETNQQGANMSFKKGDVKSEVAVADGKAEMAVGANAAVTTTDGKVEIKGGTQTVTTTDAGTVFDNGSSAVRPGGVTTTTINGNEITTGKITTDQLVITGQGNAHGNGSIAFGGNGTIKSDINDGTTNGQNTSFETTLDGVNTKVTNGTITTENKVTAKGNSNTVKQDDTHKSEFNQGFTSIGGVVTNGEIKVAQKLDGATGLLTNEVTDANGSSKLEQSGTGLTYTDSANAGNATRIDSSDVSIGSATEPDKRINLSDLGQIDELDKEIRDNEVYKNNETAVGGINAEAAIRRGEVERLDNRISEEVTRLDGRINDVNDRVNKVGAMAAAIASLKSIGYDPQAPSEFSIGLGQYKGETGVAMGFFHYPNKNFMINVSLSTAGGETMGGIGATWRFGHKSPQKLLEEQREAQAKKELAAAEKYQAAAKLAKEAQERAEYAAKLARQAQVSADNAKAAADATQAKHFG